MRRGDHLATIGSFCTLAPRYRRCNGCYTLLRRAHPRVLVELLRQDTLKEVASQGGHREKRAGPARIGSRRGSSTTARPHFVRIPHFPARIAGAVCFASWWNRRLKIIRTRSRNRSSLRRFSTGAPDYDPQVDSVVRVEVGRLRARLSDYYAKAGSEELVRIEIPRGGYRPTFVFPEGAPEIEPAHMPQASRIGNRSRPARRSCVFWARHGRCGSGDLARLPLQWRSPCFRS